MSLYLDMAATTPVSDRVAQAVLRQMTSDFGNAGSRTHAWGSAAKRAVRDARETIADELGLGADEVIFTSGATESNNIAILGLARWAREQGKLHVLSSATEHKAVLEPLEQLSAQGFEVELMEPGQLGRFDVDEVLGRVRPDTALVSLMHVNNETGVVQPVAELAESLVRSETYLHVDAAQSFAKVERDTLRAPIDLISVSGHKIGAPMGIGVLAMRRRGWAKAPLNPITFGGGQERKLRPGTVSVPLVVGLAEAVRERAEQHRTWLLETNRFRKELLAVVTELGGVVNGDESRTAPHILNVSFPGIDSEALVVALQPVAAIATGSACTSSSYTPSHVLTAMGLDDVRVAGSIRLSWWGRPTDDLRDLRATLAALSTHA